MHYHRLPFSKAMHGKKIKKNQQQQPSWLLLFYEFKLYFVRSATIIVRRIFSFFAQSWFWYLFFALPLKKAIDYR